ncbi:MAG: endonuclease [Ferruginibacter sp.]
MLKKFYLLFFSVACTVAAQSQVIITQYYEGAGVNKWIELTNVGSTSVNMTTAGLKLGLWSVSGSTGNINITGAASQTMVLTGTLTPGQTVLIGNTGNGTEVPYLTAASAYLTNNNVIAFNGNDGVALLDASNNILDAFGQGINAADISYYRNTGINTANATFTLSEWTSATLAVVQNATSTESARLGYHDVPAAAACEDPQSQPTALNLSSTPATISGSFAAAVPAANQYLVVRSLNPVLSTDPIDGTSYAAGSSLGGGVVVGTFSDLAFTDAGLSASTLYYYFIFSLNNEDCTGGPNYLEPDPLTSSVTTQTLPACATPSPATTLNLTPANNFINGSFTAAAGANRYLVIISTSSTLGASPVNGTAYTAGQAFGSGNVVSFANTTNFTATNLTANTAYYIFIFAAATECNGEPFYSTVLTGNATTTNSSTGIPAGYYDAANSLSCQPLKTALKNITSTSAVSIGYDGLWTAYQYTDLKPSSNLIWDIYTDDNNPAVPETYNFVYSTNQCGNYGSEGDCYNREHTMPKSWFNDQNPMYSDIFHIMPTDGYVNGMRGNYPYGEVTTASYTSIDNQSKRGTGNNFGYTGIVFQPFAPFRGDVARNTLYMATRYEDQIISQNWAGNSEAGVAMLGANEAGYDANRRRLQIFDDWFIKTMYKWHIEDPVSQKEIDRNNAVYYQSGQNNRNPYIDHPEYVALIWQCTGVLPVTITEFNAQKLNESVLLRWYATYETNFRNFEIERSIDGTGFYTIGQVTGQNLANYSFQDNNLPVSGIVYYRLKMIDIDGSFSYSNIIPVRLNNNFTNALVYPNPSYGPVKIRLTEALRSNSRLFITDVTGKVVKEMQVAKGVFSIDLNVQQLASGRYFIMMNDGYQAIRQSLVVIK